MQNINTIKKNKGAAMMIVVFFFMFISTTILIGIITPTLREFRITKDNFESKQAYFAAESGIEDVMYRVKNSLSTATIGDDYEIYLDGQSYLVPIEYTDLGSGRKRITATGDISSNQRTVDLTMTASTGVSFNYGVQVGQGGMDLQGSSGVTGNVYANGPITGTSSSFITGTAISANSPASIADQSNGSGIPAYNITFGNANTTQDIAQSFQLTNSLPLNKISLYIKKVGSPSNATVKITDSSSSNPNTTVYASGTLSASSVSTSYGFVDVSFTTNPMLVAGKTYWLVVDASTSSSKYYIIGASNGGYSGGLGKIGQQGGTWNNTTPSGLDYFFNVYLGGLYGKIAGSSGSQWNQFRVGTSGTGTAQAHTVNYTSATGTIYCQEGTGNNKSCVRQDDPAYIAYPISDSNITSWKDEATAGGTYTGTYNTASSGTSTLGPKKITGDLNVSGSHTLYLTGTIWVQGNVNISGSAKIVLHSSYGNTSGVVVADGRLVLSGSGQLNGTGQAGSYIVFITTSNCDSAFCAGPAIDISGAAGSVVLYAQNGTIQFTGSASAKEAVAYKMILVGATTVNYESGLADMNFNSGPSGSWSIDSWAEVE